MAAVEIGPNDLGFIQNLDTARALWVISSTVSRAAQLAPCILSGDLPDGEAEAAKAVLLDAIVRRYENTPGLNRTRQAGDLTESADATKLPVLFWPSEITELQNICRGVSAATPSPGPLFSFADAPPWPS